MVNPIFNLIIQIREFFVSVTLTYNYLLQIQINLFKSDNINLKKVYNYKNNSVLKIKIIHEFLQIFIKTGT